MNPIESTRVSPFGTTSFTEMSRLAVQLEADGYGAEDQPRKPGRGASGQRATDARA